MPSSKYLQVPLVVAFATIRSGTVFVARFVLMLGQTCAFVPAEPRLVSKPPSEGSIDGSARHAVVQRYQFIARRMGYGASHPLGFQSKHHGNEAI